MDSKEQSIEDLNCYDSNPLCIDCASIQRAAKKEKYFVLIRVLPYHTNNKSRTTVVGALRASRHTVGGWRKPAYPWSRGASSGRDQEQRHCSSKEHDRGREVRGGAGREGENPGASTRVTDTVRVPLPEMKQRRGYCVEKVDRGSSTANGREKMQYVLRCASSRHDIMDHEDLGLDFVCIIALLCGYLA